MSEEKIDVALVDSAPVSGEALWELRLLGLQVRSMHPGASFWEWKAIQPTVILTGEGESIDYAARVVRDATPCTTIILVTDWAPATIRIALTTGLVDHVVDSRAEARLLARQIATIVQARARSSRAGIATPNTPCSERYSLPCTSTVMPCSESDLSKPGSSMISPSESRCCGPAPPTRVRV